MTRFEVNAYYGALNTKNQLVCIDNTENIESITQKLQSRFAENNIDAIHVEVFRRDENVQSYTVLKQTAENVVYDLWFNKSKLVENASLDAVAKNIAENMPVVAVSPYKKYIDSTNNDGYIIKSFDDKSYSEVMTKDDIHAHNSKYPEDMILGEFIYANSKTEYHTVNHASETDVAEFMTVIDKISDDSIKLFATTCLHIIPDYVFLMPASSDYNTRSASDIADGGLKRHLINAANAITILMEPIYSIIETTQKQHETDMMIVAALFHDFLKRGWQEDYEEYHEELFDHPRLAANAIKAIKGIISDNEKTFIANCIASHMGSHNTNPDDETAVPLPVPDTEAKRLVHLADYLATRNNLMFVNNNTVYTFPSQNVKKVANFLPLNDSDKAIIENALHSNINLQLAKEMQITCGTEAIKRTWERMLKKNGITEHQEKYVAFARKTIFL